MEKSPYSDEMMWIHQYLLVLGAGIQQKKALVSDLYLCKVICPVNNNEIKNPLHEEKRRGEEKRIEENCRGHWERTEQNREAVVSVAARGLSVAS